MDQTLTQDAVLERVAVLKSWMREASINQTMLAKEIGFSDSAISRFMSGNREFTAEFEIAFMQRYGMAAAQAALGITLPS